MRSGVVARANAGNIVWAKDCEIEWLVKQSNIGLNILQDSRHDKTRTEIPNMAITMTV